MFKSYVILQILGMNYGGEVEADNAHVEWEVNGSKASLLRSICIRQTNRKSLLSTHCNKYFMA